MKLFPNILWPRSVALMYTLLSQYKTYPFWIILTSEGRGEAEQSGGHGSEWQDLAKRAGSSAVITLLSLVLSILEMGTLPRTKYWTNYASVCVVYFILLLQRWVRHVVWLLFVCVCECMSIWVKCKYDPHTYDCSGQQDQLHLRWKWLRVPQITVIVIDLVSIMCFIKQNWACCSKSHYSGIDLNVLDVYS